MKNKELLQNFPESLRQKNQWVLWKYETRDEKPTKVPYRINGARAASTRPEEWSSFDECVRASDGYDGIGFVFYDGVVGIDLDHCVNDDGEIADWAMEVVETFKSYTEFSPSGHGLHIILQSDAELPGKKKNGIECYSRGRFFTVTGNVLAGRLLLLSGDDVGAWHKKTFGEPEAKADEAPLPAAKTNLPPDDQILRIMFASKNGNKLRELYNRGGYESVGYGSQSEADLSLVGALMFFCENDHATVDRLFRSSALMRDKWDDKRGEETYGSQTITRAIASKTMEWEAPETKPERPAKPTAITSLALESKPLPRPTWLVERVIPERGLVAISGRPGSYKSFWALWLALRVSEGLQIFEAQDEPFFCEQKTAKSPVMFIEEENTEILVRDRMLGLKTPRSPNLHFRIDQGFKLGDPTWLKALEEDIHRLNIKLVIMDPFSSVMGLEDENNNAEVSQKMDIIRKTFLEKNVTVIFLHHPSKGDDSGKNLRGAGDILGKCDVHLHLEKDEIDKKLVTVSYEKMRLISDDQVQNFKMRLSGDTFFGDGEFRHVGAAKPKYEEARDVLSQKILAAFTPGEPRQKSHIAEAVGSGLSDKRFTGAWESLLDEGKLRISADKKNGKPLFLKPLI